jgi:hypothetical protein
MPSQDSFKDSSSGPLPPNAPFGAGGRQDSMASGASTPTWMLGADYAPPPLSRHEQYPAWSSAQGNLPISAEEIDDIFEDLGGLMIITLAFLVVANGLSCFNLHHYYSQQVRIPVRLKTKRLRPSHDTTRFESL